MESLGFYVCEADLEDELIRCLGPQVVEQVLAAHGKLARFALIRSSPTIEDERSTSSSAAS
jgi:hypothetical protein